MPGRVPCPGITLAEAEAAYDRGRGLPRDAEFEAQTQTREEQGHPAPRRGAYSRGAQGDYAFLRAMWNYRNFRSVMIFGNNNPANPEGHQSFSDILPQRFEDYDPLRHPDINWLQIREA